MRMPFSVRDLNYLATAALAASGMCGAAPLRANSVVEVLTCQPSSQGARITVDLKGKSVKDVTLVITTLENQLVQSVALNDSGSAKLPPLPPGKYLVTASAPENLAAEMCVEIPHNKLKQLSSFSLVLQTQQPNALPIEAILITAEKNPPSEHIEEFKGIVVDPAGATIAGAEIEIFPKGARIRGDARAVKSKTNAEGQFSVPLAEGVYTALFMIPGFQTKVVTFEINHSSGADGLRVSLQMGATT
jgi:hypothetical protein